jgi:hypothetical protein
MVLGMAAGTEKDSGKGIYLKSDSAGKILFAAKGAVLCW